MNEIYRPFQPTLTQPGLKQFGLTMKSTMPWESLKGIVYSYLQIKAEKPTPYPVMPDGTQAIYMSAQGLMIGGAQLQARDIQLLKPGEYFGVWFYPGSLRHFFDLNLVEISGELADAKFFPCHYLSHLHMDIYRCKDFSDRVKVCERWLLSRYLPKPATKFDQALSLIYQSLGSERINQLANKVGWSSRQLNRQFLQHTGLNTKTFSQIVRIQHACRKLYTKENQRLSAGLDFGYYDQSHSIKEFKKHLKSTPGAFFNRFMSDFYNH